MSSNIYSLLVLHNPGCEIICLQSNIEFDICEHIWYIHTKSTIGYVYLIAHIIMCTYRSYDFLEFALTPCVTRSEGFMNSLLYQMPSLLLYYFLLLLQEHCKGKGFIWTYSLGKIQHPSWRGWHGVRRLHVSRSVQLG